MSDHIVSLCAPDGNIHELMLLPAAIWRSPERDIGRTDYFCRAALVQAMEDGSVACPIWKHPQLHDSANCWCQKTAVAQSHGSPKWNQTIAFPPQVNSTTGELEIPRRLDRLIVDIWDEEAGGRQEPEYVGRACSKDGIDIIQNADGHILLSQYPPQGGRGNSPLYFFEYKSFGADSLRC